MGKQNPNQQAGRGPAMINPPGGVSTGTFKAATLVGMAVVIVMTGWNLRQSEQRQTDLDAKLAQLDQRITTLGTKIDSQARAAAQPQPSGPDPNKVYAVKTDGAPFEGPKSAPVTIVEFSDFQ